MSKLRPSKRASAAIAAVMAVAVSIGGYWYAPAPTGKQYPAAVVLAAEHLLKGWEGLRLTAYRDMVGVWTICYGETQGVRAGMRKTKAECEAMLYERLHRDFWLPIVACAPPLKDAPIPVQTAMLSGAWNIGVGYAARDGVRGRGWCGSTASRHIRNRQWMSSCDALTMYNRAGGRVVQGLVNRREMGNPGQMGEGELCVTPMGKAPAATTPAAPQPAPVAPVEVPEAPVAPPPAPAAGGPPAALFIGLALALAAGAGFLIWRRRK